MNKRIRILYTISNFNTAGSGKVVHDLANRLDKTKFDIEIACGSDKGDFFSAVKALGFPIHIFETKTAYRPYYSLLFRVLKISKFYKKHQYDIVHSWQWSNDWTEVLAARLVGKKWLYTKKAMGFKSYHWRIKSYLANFIVTVNDDMQKYFINKKAQRLIPFGIDTDYYNLEHFQNNINKNNATFRIITVANLVSVKRIEDLIKAVHNLDDERINLTIIGSNSNDYGQEMQALTQSLQLGKQIEFLGKQPDVRPFFSQADLYVISSEKEGMPMALVEAMSMGIPTLGTDIYGINFVLKNFKNLLFPLGDVEALGQKIKYIQNLDQRGRDQIGASLRQYCVDHFSMTSFIEEHEDLYIKLAGRG
jgi:glycosyltransferase involved in cell wall biosynthesis